MCDDLLLSSVEFECHEETYLAVVPNKILPKTSTPTSPIECPQTWSSLNIYIHQKLRFGEKACLRSVDFFWGKMFTDRLLKIDAEWTANTWFFHTRLSTKSFDVEKEEVLSSHDSFPVDRKQVDKNLESSETWSSLTAFNWRYFAYGMSDWVTGGLSGNFP